MRIRALAAVAVVTALFAPVASARTFVVNNVEANETDLTGSIRQIADKNGTPCAVLRVHIPVPAKFKGEIYGDIEKSGNEYTLYISTDSKNLQIYPEKSQTLNVDLQAYPCYPYRSKMSYVMEIVPDDVKSAEENLDYLTNEELMKKAEAGDVLACYSLGSAYCVGQRGLDVDYENGFKWLMKAAAKGHAASQCEVGKFYFQGAGGVGKNDAEAFKWFRRAADGGNGNAQFMMATKYCADMNAMTADDMKNAKYWLNKAVENDYPLAHLQLSLIHFKEGNIDKAVKSAEKVAMQGHAYGQCLLGLWYCNGDLDIYDLEKGLFWIELSAEGGFPTAQYFLGDAYENGDGRPKDIKKAEFWYRRAADGGDQQASEALKRLGK